VLFFTAGDTKKMTSNIRWPGSLLFTLHMSPNNLRLVSS